MYTQGEGLLSNSDFLVKSLEYVRKENLVKDNKNVEWYNIPAAFDIEVSSFYQGEKLPENKRAIMYIWQFGIGNLVTTGRTWEEFLVFIEILKKALCLNDKRRLVVYVHNLQYEFQFIRKRIDFDKIFFLEKRKPVYASYQGIEFRCSLKLSGGKSLEAVGKDLKKYKISKMVGYLDYKIIRTPLTPLSEEELLYCENDIRVLESYIQEKIEQDGDITRIPLTNTGYVRRYCREECFSRWVKYHALMSELTIEPDEYSQLKQAFQGGFTHASAKYVGKKLEKVGSHDLASSYPAVIVLEKFPMSKAKVIDYEMTEEEIGQYMRTHCCLFDMEIFNLRPRLYFEHPLSKSKCWEIVGGKRKDIDKSSIIDNGRVVFANHLYTAATEQDYFVYNVFYEWDSINISNFRVYRKGYLPKSFVLSILKLYKDKTELKGVKGEELHYMISKNMINAGFGMSVTNPVREVITYEPFNDEEPFKGKPGDIEKEINKYNTNVKRFLYYPWGIWITSYARANLFSAIVAFGEDYIYSDTDSVKSFNTEKHLDYINRYNAGIMEKIKKAATFHRIDESLFMPKSKDGKERPIGVWDFEGIYDYFKTLGAKRYLTFRYEKLKVKQGDKDVSVFEDNGINVELWQPVTALTLAGASKYKTGNFLRSTLDAFENFDFGLVVPADKSGRVIMTYIDEETEGIIVDCNGVPYHYHELSSIHMEESEYNLSISTEFDDYLKGLVILDE